MNKERYGNRDLHYSAWHRTIGPEFTYTDIDSLEYCQKCLAPLVLIETAIDVGQVTKYVAPAARLAARSGLEFYLVFYALDCSPPPTVPPVPPVSPTFRVKKVGERPIRTMTANEYIEFLKSFRRLHRC